MFSHLRRRLYLLAGGLVALGSAVLRRDPVSVALACCCVAIALVLVVSRLVTRRARLRELWDNPRARSIVTVGGGWALVALLAIVMGAAFGGALGVAILICGGLLLLLAISETWAVLTSKSTRYLDRGGK